MTKSMCYNCRRVTDNYHFVEVDTLMMRHVDDIVSHCAPAYCPVCQECAEELQEDGVMIGLIAWMEGVE